MVNDLTYRVRNAHKIKHEKNSQCSYKVKSSVANPGDFCPDPAPDPTERSGSLKKTWNNLNSKFFFLKLLLRICGVNIQIVLFHSQYSLLF